VKLWIGGRPGLAVAAFGLVALLAAMAPRQAQAQMDSREAIQLQNQLLELRRDVQALREQMRNQGSSGSSGGGSIFGGRTSGGSSGGGEITAALLDRVMALEDQVRRLQGRVDEAENARQRQGDELRKEIEDLNFKLGQGAGAARPPAAAAPAASAAGAGAAAASGGAAAPAAPPRRTPEIAMQEGNAALARRDYAAAEAAAREVLRFPQAPRAADAQFLLAQALNGKRDYQGAAVAYDDTYNRNKTGGNAQPALLGLANALVALNEKRAACATLDKLRAEFPNPRADLREPINGARQRAGCR
jgi:TolA-binding protein